MKSYLDIVRNIIENGIPKQPTRMVDGKAVKVTNGTIGLPAQTFIHDMRTGFPALTTRKIAFKSTMIELEGFIKGITDKNWYQERKCKFWDGWANRLTVEKKMLEWQNTHASEFKNGKYMVEASTKVHNQLVENDLGPIYGYQWRKFDQHYGEFIIEDVGEPNAGGEYQTMDNRNGVDGGFDQLQSIVDSLKKNPYDRRMVCSAWNPNQMDMMALPPCHFAWNVVVYGDTISLIWHQRSCDLMCGVSHNIASYAALLCLLGKMSGLTPWILKGDLNDCHIYENQIDNAKEQLEREPRALPQLEISQQYEGDFDIFKWTYEDVKLVNYDPHPALKFEVTI